MRLRRRSSVERLRVDRELADVPVAVTDIRPTRGWVGPHLRELWRYRELFYFLVWRNVKIRYKQTFIGMSWAVIQPFVTMVVFSIFFGALAKIPSDGIPYPIFSFCGLLPWQLFATGVRQSSNSLIGNAALVTKIYFPRLLIPSSAVLTGLVDFAIAFVVLVGMMLFYGFIPTWQAAWLPVFLLVAMATSLGIGMWLSAISVRYRDVQHIVGFVTQMWMFATPVIYPTSLFRGRWSFVLTLNPMSSVVEGFRWALLGSGQAPSRSLGVACGVAVTLLVSGVFVFRRAERSFADFI